MFNRCMVFGIAVFFFATTMAKGGDKVLTPNQARDQVGEKITVKMKVLGAKDRLEKKGEIYLDSEEDFKSPDNFAVIITRKGAASLKKSGIGNPAQHFQNKVIQVSGSVKEVDGVPRIEVDDTQQIRLLEK